MLKVVQMSLLWFALAALLFVFAGYFDRQAVNLGSFALAALITVISVVLKFSLLLQIICFISLVIILLFTKHLIEKIPFHHLESLVGQYGEIVDDSDQLIAQIGKHNYKVESHLKLKKHDEIKVLKTSRTSIIVRRVKRKKG